MENEQNKELIIPAKYRMRLIRFGLLSFVLVVILSAIFFKGYFNAKEKYETIIADLKQEIADLQKIIDDTPVVWPDHPSTEITLDMIQSEIKEIGELATVEYLYTDAGKFEDAQKLFGIDLPFTTKYFIAKWDGIIKAGIRIDQIIVEINDAKKEIIIHMPQAEILSHEIVSDSIETLDEKDGLFNPIKVDDVRLFDEVSKEAMEQRVKEHGLLQKALDNAKAIIEKLVNTDVVQEQGYSIQFQDIK